MIFTIGFFIVLGMVFIILSKSNRAYKKMVDENGVENADRNMKILRRCGYIIVIFSFLKIFLRLCVQ